MKLAVITNKGSIFGKKVLNGLAAQRIMADAVIVVSQPRNYYWKMFKSVRRKVGLYDALYFSVERLFHSIFAPLPSNYKDRAFVHEYEKLARVVFYVKGTNTPDTKKVLRKISPDILILGQAGILREETLRIPAIGAINAHPGILPFYRGIDTHLWAIYNRDFNRIGSTVHWVDSGVDTGNIIKKREYNFFGNETISMLETKLYDLAINLLMETLVSFQNRDIPGGERQQVDQGKQFFKMPLHLVNSAKRNLKRYLQK
jgi:folate-dependent phosphoribosylglycinamide formyltransferase PurN